MRFGNRIANRRTCRIYTHDEQMKRILFITNAASFYKINLYNELQKKINVEAIFLDGNYSHRNADFLGNERNFKYYELSEYSFLSQIRRIVGILRNGNYDKVVYTGWDKSIYYLLALITSKMKNGTVVESSYIESKTTGLKAIIKRLFLSRISTAYVSGEAQKKLMEALKFKGEIIKTFGVGLRNYIPQASYKERNLVSKFLFVGRLTPVKNLEFLINYFNQHPELKLTIVGFGIQEEELRKIAADNVHFTGAIDNKKLPSVYQSHDVFILPSKSEPWGLVVEEALNNGLPVLVSDKVGCAEDIVKEGENGFIFKYDSLYDLDVAVSKVTDIDAYNRMAKHISETDIEAVKEKQVSGYL